MSDEKKEKSAAVNEAAPCPNSQLYTIKPGDTLYSIAKRFNVSVANLHNANPQIVDPNVIYPGQTLVIPGLGTIPATWPQPPMRVPMSPVIPPAPECPDGQIYQVVSGDTMFKIAQRFEIDLDTLVQANPQIPDPNWIYPGQEICIPGTAVPPSCVDGVAYTVKAGDTLFEIAKQNGVMLSDLIAANPQISDPDRVFPGQVICIPASATMPQPPELPVEYPGAPPPLPEQPPVALPPPLTPMPYQPDVPLMVQPPMPPPCPYPVERPAPRPYPVERPAPRPYPVERPAPRPYPVERPTPCPYPVERPAPRPYPVERPAPRPYPVERPAPAPCRPMPGEQPTMYPMPVYVVVPWDECPYRPKGKKKKRSRKGCGCK
jgi:spore coat assembly protein SafA